MITNAIHVRWYERSTESLVKIMNPPVVKQLCHVYGQLPLQYFVVVVGAENSV
jgi:hypothetical protein